MTAPLHSQPMVDHYRRLVARNMTRDRHHELIHSVRQGNIRQLFPEELNFSISFDGSPIANFVDIVARDMAEGIAPLPALACSSGKMASQADQARAEIKNRIGDWYWRNSRLELQMLRAADRFVSYGFVPMYVEPCPDEYCQSPLIHLEDPRKSYYELDRRGNTVVYAHSTRKSIDQLCAAYPDLALSIRKDPQSTRDVENGNTELEVVKWVDNKHVTLFMPERQGLVLDRFEHRMSRTPVWIAERPGESDNPRGQFDDVIWVQVARSIMSTLALEAASIAVQAPIVVPDTMDQLSYGPHAVLQAPAQDAAAVKKLDLQLPPQIFAESQVLDNELRVGARYPEARSGDPGTSVITGKGVQALLGSFDSQIKGAQLVFKEAFQQVTSMCFEMDEKWWPNTSKTVSGTISGSSFEFVYTPSKDINHRWDCTVTYGFAAGLAPEQSIITMLQLEGAGLIAKGTTQQNLPFGVDHVQETRKIDIEGSREALKQGVFALVQSSGQMAANGQDPMPIIQLAVSMIDNLEKGKPVEAAVQMAYEQMQQQQQEAAQQAQEQQQEQAAAAGGGGADLGPGGLPPGVAEGQAGLPPGGRPTIQSLIAGFRGGGSTPVLQGEIRRMLPTGAP